MANRQELTEQWKQRLKAWRESGLNQKQWCEQNNVRQSRFWIVIGRRNIFETPSGELAITTKRSLYSLEELAKLVNPYVQGWINYYYGKFYSSELKKVLNYVEATWKQHWFAGPWANTRN